MHSFYLVSFLGKTKIGNQIRGSIREVKKKKEGGNEWHEELSKSKVTVYGKIGIS